MAAISLGTALAIGAISAGGSVAKGAIQARAAGKAAKQQAKGAQDAARQMQQGFGSISQLYSPYLQRGASVSNTLGRLTTPGAGARFASPGPPPLGPPQQQGPGTGMAMPRMGGGVQGPYMMAEGGDMVVDKPTMFIAGEAGPERATFGPIPDGRNPNFMQQQAGPYQPQARPEGLYPPRPAGPGGGISGDIKSRVMAKYGGGGGPMDPRRAAMAMRGGPGGRPMPPQGAGGWGGAFAQMMGPQMQRPPMRPPGGFPPGGPGGPPPGAGGPPPQQGPPMDPRYQAMMAQRAQGAAMGQDMSWMDQPGATTPQAPPQWAQAPQGWGYY